jgi:hypothetical protein
MRVIGWSFNGNDLDARSDNDYWSVLRGFKSYSVMYGHLRRWAYIEGTIFPLTEEGKITYGENYEEMV